MVFRNAKDLEAVRFDSWFRAGALEVSKDAAYCDTLDRYWFDFEKDISSRKPVKCLSVLLPDNSDEHWNQLLKIKSITTGATATSFAPLNQLEEMFGMSRDPESLDDSDMDDFLGSSQRIDSHRTGFNDKVDDIALHREYLLVSPNSVFKAGDPNQTLLDGGIVDCQVVNTFPGKLGSILLITTSTGYILSMLLGLDNDKCVILQYWKLRQNSGDWHIVNHKSNCQFVVVNKDKGICRFFEFRDPLHFKLVNNLTIDNTKFLDCSFFHNTSESHYLFFVPSIRYHRMVLFCIEWDSLCPELKQVHQLTYLNGHKVNYCAPIGQNVCLVSSGDLHYLVSAHQIMSGETNFQLFESKFLEDPCSYFDAPMLLRKLKLIHGDQFAYFTKCTVLATFTGNIGICLWGENGEAMLCTLTRFKGLKDVCPVDLQETVDDEYEIIVISFGRTLRLTLDIKCIQQLRTDTNIPSLNGVLFKHTMDSSSEENSELQAFSPPKNNSRFDLELWLTSSMGLSHLQTFAPVRKVHELCKLRQFQIFNSLKVFSCSDLCDNLKEALLQGIEFEDESEIYLVIASDLISMTKAFLLQVGSFESNTMELDDLLQSVAGDNVESFFTAGGNMIQITNDTVYVDPLSSTAGGRTETYFPGWKIDGSVNCGSKVIIWNVDELKISYIDDIDQLGLKKGFSESGFFQMILQSMKEEHNDYLVDELEKYRGFVAPFTFEVAMEPLENGIILVYVGHKFGLKKYVWEDLLRSSTERDVSSDVVNSLESFGLLPQKDYLYFVSSTGILYGVGHMDSSQHILDLGYGNKDVQIRPLDDTSIVVFSPQEITVVSKPLKSEDQKVYELKLPFQNKPNPILDVYVDPKRNKVFVLYSDGLQVFELSYFTWNNSNYLLKSTKTLKRFFFLNKINRMLVVNLRAKEWDCIKLVDGKSLSLDPTVLKNPKNLKLLEVIEIPTIKEHKNVQLLLNFGKLLKLVRLVPKKGRIIVQEVTQCALPSEVFNRIEVLEDGNFILYFPSTISPTSLKPTSQFIVMKIDEMDQFKETGKLEFPDELHLQDFKLCNKDVAVINKDYDRLFLFKDFLRLVKLKRPMAVAIKMPAASRVEKICPTGADSFVVVVSCEARSDHLTELLFCHRDDICLSSENTSDSDKNDVLYDAAVVDDIQRREEGDFYRIELEDVDDVQINDGDDDDDDDADADFGMGPIGLRIGRRGNNWDGNYRDFLDRIINGPRMVPTEDWEFDDFDMEYEVGQQEQDGENDRESDTDEEMLDTDEMDEMDETDAFDRRDDHQFPFNTEPSYNPTPETLGFPFNSSDLAESLSTSRLRKPYQVINLDRSIKDIQFQHSKKGPRLFLLATDGSVLIFKSSIQNLSRDAKNIGNGVTSILKNPITRQVSPKITESGICKINDQGRVNEWPWL